ncbi:hypothetical protein B0T24DRAFT_540256 [Lasiosphaeria ovina]|uniref:C2H2-type domain-containing protein n=1 Tax=Lasiosphaeria ovina TaxID=92902 RepID=A0AAE0JRU7_9PEZI|nr:hypothetical protein B0T24DRAFT_540256 [Lasiosphaeria ovina]
MQNHLASPRNQGPLQQRKAGRGQPRDDEDDSDHDGRRKRSKHPPSAKAAANNAEVGKKFACPYFKRNRRKYHKWTSCPGPGWDEVHRVKTHLYRRHALPIQCPRCWEVFKSDNQLRSHLQQDPPCDIRESTPVEGFSKDQEKRLRSRKKVQNDMTDEDKWREIYMILFPDDDRETIPSPYYDELDEEADESSVGGSELEEYATFIRREMPTLVRRELEMLFQDQFQDVDERVRPRVADIVLNLQPRLLRLFKQSQSPLSGYGPQHEVAGSGSGSDPSLTPSLSQGTGTGTDWASAEGTDHEGALPLGAENFPFNVDDLFDFDEGAIDTNLNWHAPGQATHGGIQPQTATRDTNVNAWDYEFDKLMNPSLYPTYGGDLSGIYSHPETSNQEPALAPLTGRGDL